MSGMVARIRGRMFAGVLVVALASWGLGIATAASGGAAGSVRGFDGSTITVGALAMKSQLPNAEAGARARLQRFNETNEVKGIKVDYKEFVDDKQDPAVALSEARRLVSQVGIFALVGNVSAVNPTEYLEQQHVPSFGGGFDSTYCTPKPSKAIWGFSPLGCTVPHEPSFVYDAMSGGYEYVSKKVAKAHPTMVVFASNTELGKDGAQIVAVAAQGAGFKVTAVETKYELPVSDYSPYVDSILVANHGSQPDVAYCAGGVECINFNGLLKERGFNGIFWHAMYSDLLVKAMAGTIVSIYAANPNDDSKGLRQIKADMDAYMPGGSNKIDIGTIIGYTSTDMFVTALKKAAKQGKAGITPENVRKVASTMTWKIDGLAGPVQYPKSSVIGYPSCRSVMLSDGTKWNTVVPFGCSTKTFSPNLKLG